jgi:DNA-binding NarL/FixJ family response regulator
MLATHAGLREACMKILVADDHPLFRAGIRHVLMQLADNVAIEEADDHAAVMNQLVKHSDIALVVLDLLMPGVQGLTSLDVITQKFPALPIVILSASEDRAAMQRALDSGALGFIQKSATAAVMLSALRLVLAGGVYVPPALVQGMASIEPVRVPSKHDDLTPRQSAVLALVVEGKSNKAIAVEMGLTEATVKAHVTAVFKVLRVSNRMQAAIAAGRLTASHF